jgi:hypothetical protein
VRRFGFVMAFDLPLVLFVASAFAALRVAHDPISAGHAMSWLAAGAILALVVGYAARDKPIWQLAAYAAVCASGLAAAYIVVQFRFLEVDAKIPIITALGNAMSGPFPRIGLWSPFSNSVATLLEGLLLLGVGMTLDDRSRLARAPLALASLAMLLAVLLSMSRGSWMAVGAAGLVWATVAILPRPLRGPLAAGVMLGVLALGLLMTFRIGVDSVAAVSSAVGGAFARADRLDVYQSSVTLLDDVGVTGLGPGGQFADPFSRFALLIQVPFLTYPHQLSLHLWLAYGVAGIAAWTWWIAGCAASVGEAERHRPSRSFQGAWAGMLAMLVHGLSDARQAVDGWTWLPFFLLAGLMLARSRRLNPEPGVSTMALPFVCVLGLLGAATWRYSPFSASWETNAGLVDEARSAFGVASGPARTALVSSALEHYGSAVVRNPSQVGARRRLALAAADRGEFEPAWEHARVALNGDARSLASRKVAGLTAAWSGHVDDAVQLLAPLPGMSDELRVWSAAWGDRGYAQASVESNRAATAIDNALRAK